MINHKLAIATVVTVSTLDEFQIMKFSFELFHGTKCRWFIRCDRASEPSLLKHPNTSCTVFTDRICNRPKTDSIDFKNIVVQKMNAMDDAWNSGCGRVVFLDSDLVITSPFLEEAADVNADLVLSTNHYPDNAASLAERFGYYNGGFVLTSRKDFPEWWRRLFLQADTTFDQLCLNQATNDFTIHELGADYNIGFWGSIDMEWKKVVFQPIPASCRFLHVHLFQPLLEERGWLDRLFGLHCLRFLHSSATGEHRVLVDTILGQSPAQWYLRMISAYDRRAARDTCANPAGTVLPQSQSLGAVASSN